VQVQLRKRVAKGEIFPGRIAQNEKPSGASFELRHGKATGLASNPFSQKNAHVRNSRQKKLKNF